MGRDRRDGTRCFCDRVPCSVRCLLLLRREPEAVDAPPHWEWTLSQASSSAAEGRTAGGRVFLIAMFLVPVCLADFATWRQGRVRALEEQQLDWGRKRVDR